MNEQKSLPGCPPMKAKKDKNIETIKNEGFEFKLKNQDRCLCFREKGKPMVNYYPTADRWQIVGALQSELVHGNVDKFIKWYESLSPGGDAQ